MVIRSIYKWLSFSRMKQIELMGKYPFDFQAEQFVYLISAAKNTVFGKKYDFASIDSYEDYKNKVPVFTYDDIKPYIKRMFDGEENVLWPGKVKWFAKSSGTTSDKSKFIPVTEDSLSNTHYKGGKDIFAVYVNNFPETRIFTGKALSIGGSHKINRLTDNSYYGDLSAILIRNLPFWAEFFRVPSRETALLDDWEKKIEQIAKESVGENVTTVAGVPSWTKVVFDYILEYTGKKNILEVWENFELFVHGGVSFSPYVNAFKKLLPSDNVNYLETYNASEGFFAIQTDTGDKDLMLMLDYQIFYEFIPFEDFVAGNYSNAVPLEGVKTGEVYVILISTNGGLWRYVIGDTIEFASLNPHKIRIVGRTKYYINIFGEELMLNNVEKAISEANKETGAIIGEYTVAPVFMDENNKKGAHEWAIEFEKMPDSVEKYAEALDKALQEANSDYEAKRYKDFTLLPPVIRVVPPGTFHKWLKQKEKLGGQHKVPHLSNDRKILEEILTIVIN